MGNGASVSNRAISGRGSLVTQTGQQRPSLLQEVQHPVSVGRDDPHRHHDANRKSLIEAAFSKLSSILSVPFDLKQLHSQSMSASPGQLITERGKQCRGIYIVVDGVLSILEPTNDILLGTLTKGDIFGEIETLVNYTCCMTVYVEKEATLIHISSECVKSSITGTINRARMKEWCAQKGYVGTNGLFDENLMTISIIMQAFQSSALFRLWNIQPLEFMSKLCLLTLFDTGTVLVNQGEPSNHIFILVKGKIKVVEQQKEVEVKFVTECYTIGAKDFFTKENRQQTIHTIAPSLILAISKEVILTTLDAFPSEHEVFKHTVIEYTQKNN